MTDKCEHEDGCVKGIDVYTDNGRELTIDYIREGISFKPDLNFKHCLECGHKIEETK